MRVVNASAATDALRASYYLDNYAASVSTGGDGKIIVSFDVNATKNMSSVGASYIAVQVYSNGAWIGVSSYFGSTTSGMLAYNTSSNAGTITFYGNSGFSYRALVAVYAANSSGSDSRTITTNTIIA